MLIIVTLDSSLFHFKERPVTNFKELFMGWVVYSLNHLHVGQSPSVVFMCMK